MKVYSAIEIIEFLNKEFPNIDYGGDDISDAKYVLPTLKSIRYDFADDLYELFIKTNIKNNFNAEILDCDNYAKVAAAWATIKHNQHLYNSTPKDKRPPDADIAFGQINYYTTWGNQGYHRANFFIHKSDGELVVKGFEPQTLKIFSFTDDEKNSARRYYL